MNNTNLIENPIEIINPGNGAGTASPNQMVCIVDCMYGAGCTYDVEVPCVGPLWPQPWPGGPLG